MAGFVCTYCGSSLDGGNLYNMQCPVCGGNGNLPKTIEQLKEWYKEMNLPPEEITRFFIGKNITEPKAFGIYQDGNSFIVYKNKSDGVRNIRYQGLDEAFAVKELYLRLKEEIENQKNNSFVQEQPTISPITIDNNDNSNNSNNSDFCNDKSSFKQYIFKIIDEKFFTILNISVLIFFVFIIKLFITFYINYIPNNTFYKYDNNIYYYHKDIFKDNGDSGWFIYNGFTESWDYFCDVDSTHLISEEFKNNHPNYCIGTINDYKRDLYGVYYYEDYVYNNNYDYGTSHNSGNSYNSNSSNGSYSSYDSGSSYDSHSWNSSYTNWDSDW